MTNLRGKVVFRHDEIQGHFRLFRIMWETGQVGDGTGHSNMISVAVQPTLFRWARDYDGSQAWMLVLLGIRIHRKVSYGGRFA